MSALVQSVYSLISSPGDTQSNLLSLADNDLLKVANELNTIFGGEFDIQLPEIVVVGSQSSGKSSTLNGLLNMNILPTGKQIVTRTPTNMRLINWTKKVCKIEFYEYVETMEKTLKTFELNPTLQTESETEQIQNYILTLTKRYAGEKKNIVDKPIRMNIYSPNVPNLVLTDLPGLTKIALKEQGQPDDISAQIEAMIEKYIKKEKCIIMSIVPATVDLETDAGLALIKKHDPTGERTVGVFTKPDLAGKECNLNDYIDGRLDSNLKLKYGYFVVKNTSKDDEETANSSKDLEHTYFSTHTSLKNVTNKTRLGLNNLGHSLSVILINNVKAIIPELIEKLRDTEKEIDSQLDNLGIQFPKDDKSRRVMINLLVTEFQKVFASSIKDRGTTYNTGTQLTIAYKYFKNKVNSLDPFNKTLLTDDMIDNVVSNYEGIHMPSSTTTIGVLELCFSGLHTGDVKDNTLKIEPIYIIKSPLAECIKNVQSIILDLTDSILLEDRFSRFPNLAIAIRSVITDTIIPEKYERTSNMVNDILKMEKECIWTDDDEFRKVLQSSSSSSINESIRNVLNAYYASIKKVLMHNVHKTIQTFFVNGIIEELTVSLLMNVLANNTEESLMKENEDKAKKRDYLLNAKSKIDRAKTVIFKTKVVK